MAKICKRVDKIRIARSAVDVRYQAAIASASEIPCLNGGLGEVIDSAKDCDPAAHKLAEKLGGRAQAEFHNAPNFEYDVISDQYVVQAKPAIIVTKKWRKQARGTFQIAEQSGRKPYFQFDGEPERQVLEALERYKIDEGVDYVLDIGDLG